MVEDDARKKEKVQKKLDEFISKWDIKDNYRYNAMYARTVIDRIKGK